MPLCCSPPETGPRAPEDNIQPAAGLSNSAASGEGAAVRPGHAEAVYRRIVANAEPDHDRPRERMLTIGPEALKDSELLALCLGHGTAGARLQELSKQLLTTFGSVGAVLRARPELLLEISGIGAARVCALKAVLALAERAFVEEIGSRPVLGDASAVKRLLQVKLDGQLRELFAAVFLDTRHRLIGFEVLFTGTIDSASVYPRELIRRCMEVNAAAIILAHNHPSGLAEPSVADIALTERLRPILGEVGVRLLDHIVVGRGQTVSMAERGLF